jgi:hypothetical protein
VNWTRLSIIGPSPKRQGHGPTRRIGERRTRAKPHHKIGAPTREADQARQFRPQASDFDGLIHESTLETERGRLQRKTLGGATSQEPVLMVLLLRNEDCDTGGRRDLPGVFVVLRTGLER